MQWTDRIKERSSTVQKRCFLGVNSLHLEPCMGCRFYGGRTCYRHTTISMYYIDTRTFWHSLYDMLTHCGLMHQITIHWRIRLWHFPPVRNSDSKNSGFKFPENISRYHLISKSWQRNWMRKRPWKLSIGSTYNIVYLLLLIPEGKGELDLNYGELLRFCQNILD